MAAITVKDAFGANVTLDSATEVKQDAQISKLTSIDVKLPALSGGRVPVDVEIDQPLTDIQLRATPVPVSGTVTTGGLTDAQLRATPVPVSASTLPLPTGAATETTLAAANAKLPAIAAANSKVLNSVPAIPVAERTRRVFCTTFASAISGGVDTSFWSIIGGIGAGMTVEQTGGNLVIGGGTIPRSETIIRSVQSFRKSMNLSFETVSISARNANNFYQVELVDVIGDGLAYTITSSTTVVVTIPSNPFTAESVGQSVHLGKFVGTGTFQSGRYAIAAVSGNDVTFTVSGFSAGTGTVSVFGWNYYRVLYTGTPTQAEFQTQRRGYQTTTGVVTISTTASSSIVGINAREGVEANFYNISTPSGTATQITPRGSSVKNLPESETPLFIQIRALNGTVAPASTTWTLGFVSVEDVEAKDVNLVSSSAMGVAMPLPVLQIGTVAVSGSITASGVNAEDSATTSNPVIVGGVVRTALPADTNIAGDAMRATLTTSGQLIVKDFAPADLDFFVNATVTTNNQTVLRAAQGATIRQNVTAITYQNTNATATTLTIQDASATLITFSVPANMANPVQLTFPTPLRGSANAALNYIAGTAGASILLQVTGFNSR